MQGRECRGGEGRREGKERGRKMEGEGKDWEARGGKGMGRGKGKNGEGMDRGMGKGWIEEWGRDG